MFKATLNSLLNFHGCPKRKESVSETKIRTILDKTNIKYEYQKRFNCLNGKSLDFYLPEHNILIEFDGSQHYFNKGKLWGGEDGLKSRQKNDAIKTQYCLDNNIKLIRIRYDESIEERLNEIFL